MKRENVNTVSDDDDLTIDMLLDVDHYYGDHSGRVGPKVITLLLCLAPPMIYVYFGLFRILSPKIFIPIELLYCVRVLMIVPGDEKTRLKFFRRVIHNIYSNLLDLLRITYVHNNGLVEYLGGQVCYFVVAYNGNDVDTLAHASMCAKFIESCAGDKSYDQYVQNITDTNAIRERYKNVKFFGDGDAARDFMDIIDYNSEIINMNSVLQRIVFCFKGYKSDWKELEQAIDGAIHSKYAKCFKEVYRVTDKSEIQDLMSRDMDGVLPIADIMRKKYCTGEYYGSCVLCYDDNLKQTNDRKGKGQKREKVKIGDFHTEYVKGDA